MSIKEPCKYVCEFPLIDEKKSLQYREILKTSLWLELGSGRQIHDTMLRSMDMYQGTLILNTVAS